MTEPAPGPKPDSVSSAGLDAAFQAAYREEFPFVWRTVQRLGARDAEVEDHVHDVFAAALRRWSTFDRSRSLRLWLYGICFRVMLDHRRKHSTSREEPSAEPPEVAAETGPGDQVERAQGLSLARQLIDRMPLDRRAVFVAHELDGSSIPEVAEALGIPLNTAYSRLRLARRDFEAGARAAREELR